MIDNTVIDTAPVPSSEYQRMLTRGYGVIFATLFGLVVWSGFARIDSAVVAPGAISIEANRKTVQHLEGGIVGEILVRDGDAVEQGQVILRLDPTRSAASEELYRKQQAIAKALEARLQAQLNLRDQVAFPPDVMAVADDPLVKSAMSDNQRQFESRRATYLSVASVLEKQVLQARNDINQAQSDKVTAEQQLASIGKELPPLRKLLEQGLVPLPRVLNLERQEQQLNGASAKADIDLDRSRERVQEIEAKLKQLRQEYSQEAANALPEVRKTLSDVQQQLVIARDTLKRIDIVAPVTGTVQQLRMFTVGGVIKPGDAIVDVVPQSAKLQVRAKLSPLDVDRVHQGLSVEVRLPQFQRYQSETMRGSIRSISKDTLVDEATRLTYYVMDIEADRSTIPAIVNDKLTAGMTVDIIVPTGERTLLQYLVSPLIDGLAKSLRER